MTRCSVIAGLSLVVVSFLQAAAAPAQGIPADMKRLMEQKYRIKQQQADTERMRAEAERTRAEAESKAQAEARATTSQRPQPSGATVTGATSGRYIVSSGPDNVFGRVKVPAYLLPNGLVLEVSGLFYPEKGVTCVANCGE